MKRHRFTLRYIASWAVLLCLPGMFFSTASGSAAAIGDTLTGAVYGTVVTTVSRQPLRGASVRLAGTGRAVETDSSGAFHLNDLRSGTYDIQVTHVGYDTGAASAVIDQSRRVARVDFALKPSAIPLKEITVSPGRFTIMETTPAVRQTLSRRDIETIPQFGEDIYRAVTRLPGIGSNEFSARFTVRGGEHDQVLVLLDGLELYEPFHLKDVDGGALSIIDVAAIDGIDLTTGGFPAEYGNRMSGVFDIRTKQVAADSRRASFGLSMTSARALSEGAFASNRGSWLLSLRRGYVDLITSLTEEYRDISPGYYDLLSKVTYRAGSHHMLSGHFLHAHDDLDYRHENDIATTAYGSTYGWWRLQSLITRSMTAETIWSIGSLRHARRGTGYSEETNLYQYDVDDTREFDFVGLKQQFTWMPNEIAMLTLGGDMRRENTRYEYASTQRNRHIGSSGNYYYSRDYFALDHTPSGHSISGWLSGRVRSFDAITVEAGLRYDHVSYTGDRLLSPRTGVVIMLSENTAFRAGWGKYYQSQRMYELKIADGDETFYPAQLADQYVVGLEQNLGRGVELRLEGYYKKLTRLRPDYRNWLYPLQVFPEAHLDRVAIDREGGVAKGMEVYFKRDTGGRFVWWLSYALAQSREYVRGYDYEGVRTDVGENLPGAHDQRHTVYVDIGYRPAPAWQFNVAWQYHTGWPYSEGEIVYNGGHYYLTTGRLNNRRYPDYHRLDIRVNRTVNTSHGRLAFFVEVINLYDRENIRTYEYEFVENGDQSGYSLDRTEWHWFGIMPSVGLSWQVDW